MYKNRIYTTSLILLGLLMGSCHDELLNPVPESVLTTANAYSSAKDLDLAVLGVYQSLQSRLPTDYELMEVASDNFYGYYFATAPGMAEIGALDVSVENPKLNSFWKSTYNGIFRANSLLANIEIPTDYAAGQKEQFIGEAKFMRAYFYFDLVRIFGGVPAITSVVTVDEAREIPRASVQEIYGLITADLQDAVNNLPATMITGRASKAAALALLAKTSVYQKDWNAAKTNLEQLFSQFSYALEPNFGSLFRIETENNNETIFAMPYVGGTNGHGLTYALAPTGGIYGTINGGSRVARPTWDLHQAYEDGDSRFEVSIQEEQLSFASSPGDPTIWFPYFNKWIIPVEINTSSGLDLPVLRFADMVLLYSEVLYHLNDVDGALAQLNRVRERAFGDASRNYTLADISSPELFMDKLLLERRLELAGENDRWFDLVRTDRFTSVLTTIEGEYNPSTGKAVMIPLNAQPYMRYFPIPYEQIQLASPGVLVQNEGY